MTTTIHAHKRTKPYSINLVALGQVVEFAPNAAGDVVATCSNQAAAWLLNTPSGFRLYANAPEPEMESIAPSPKPKSAKYILQSEGQELDLRPLSDEALVQFCEVNKIKFKAGDHGDALRNRIVAAFSKEG